MTDDNIINFKDLGGAKSDDKEECTCDGVSEDDIVLVCTFCGCMSHYITAKGEVECTNCRAITTPDTGEWRRTLPDVPHEVTKDTGGLISSTVLGSRQMARKRVLKRLEQWEKEGQIAMVIGFSESGEGSHWFDIGTQEQKEWVVRRLRDILEYTQNHNIED